MFDNVHPSETAGDGKRRPRRTTYKPGDREIELIRCAQCGFPFREQIDMEGDTQESPGVSVAATVVTVSANNAQLPQPLKNMSRFQNGAQINGASASVNSGCRLCGTYNPRGSGRSTREWSGGPDLSNR